MRPAPRSALVALLAALASAWGCLSPEPRYVGVPETSEVRESDRERHARHALEDARALRREGRLAASERRLRRGLETSPDHPRLHRTLAEILEAQGRPEEAESHRAAAQAVMPAAQPPPDRPLGPPTSGVVVVLQAPPRSDESPERVPARWPEGVVAETLERRLRVRLPDAELVHAAFETVRAARRWLPEHAPRAALSLRVDRAWCGESIKDGYFGMVWLRVAAQTPDGSGSDPEWARVVLNDPPQREACLGDVVALALEEALGSGTVREALAAPEPPRPAWSTAAIRALFPGLGVRIGEEVEIGHALLARGEVEQAAEAFRRAARIDPDDLLARSYLGEAEATLTLSRELSARRGAADRGRLDPRFTPEQLKLLEARLAEEKRLRGALLGALAVLEEDVELADPEVLAALRPARIADPDGLGPQLARQRAGGPIEARHAYAPDGQVLARYYFPAGSERPVLRQDDTDGDGVPDRWIGYTGTVRTEIWEDRRGSGRPEVHFVFAPPGSPLLRIELDASGDGRPDRIFHYAAGALVAETRDTSGDGRLDTFDRFDDRGRLAVREEDLDGDGQVDVRSVYRAGKLVRRELSSPELAPDDT